MAIGLCYKQTSLEDIEVYITLFILYPWIRLEIEYQYFFMINKILFII